MNSLIKNSIKSSSVILLLMAVTSVQAQTPPATTLIYPEANAVIPIETTTPTILFQWEASAGADSYLLNIQIRKNGQTRPMAPITTESTNTAVNFNLGLDEVGAQVNWAVLPRSGENVGPVRTSTFFFGGLTNLPAPDLILPPDNSNFSLSEVSQGLGITFTWNNVSGAILYQFSVYRDNSPIRRINTTNTRDSFLPTRPVEELYQWDVLAFDTDGVPGTISPRRSFRVGAGELPTPTPSPLTADLNGDGNVDAADLFQFARDYLTNEPSIDFDYSGLANSKDLLLFIEMYKN